MTTTARIVYALIFAAVCMTPLLVPAVGAWIQERYGIDEEER